MATDDTTQQFSRHLATMLAKQDDSMELCRHTFDLLRDQMGAAEMEFDADDNILFRYQGIHFMVSFDRQDAGYMRVIYLPFSVITDQDEIFNALATIDHVNRSVKVAKLWTLSSRSGVRVAASAECWFFRTEDVSASRMTRLIEVLFAAVKDFSAARSDD